MAMRHILSIDGGGEILRRGRLFPSHRRRIQRRLHGGGARPRPGPRARGPAPLKGNIARLTRGAFEMAEEMRLLMPNPCLCRTYAFALFLCGKASSGRATSRAPHNRSHPSPFSQHASINCPLSLK